MEEMLFGSSATDPMAYAPIAVLMILVAGVAAFGSARRATRVDPVEVLRG